MVLGTETESLRRSLATQELIRGHDLTTQLGILLKEASGDGGGGVATSELVEEVLNSISRALAALNAGNSSEVVQDRAASQVGTACSGGCGSVSGDGKRKIRESGARRGGYRRRTHPYTCSSVTSKTIVDGQTWRKYGQKEIHSSKFPRSYFRCTHKYDRGCQATRQVQKSEEDPSMFVITYIGEHTCSNQEKALHPSKNSNIDSPSRENCVLSFESYPISIPMNWERKEELSPLLCSSVPSSSLKKEVIEEDMRSDLSHDGSTLDYPALPEIAEFDASLRTARISFHGGSDQGDVTSGRHSSTAVSGELDMDFMAESFDFDDVFSLELDFFKI